MLASQFMETEEEEFTKRTLIKVSGILGGLGLLLLILGFLMPSGALRGIGNLLILFGILLWVYKYFLAGRVQYFQYEALQKLENSYEKFLKYALREKKAYAFFFGTIGLLIFSFILVGIVQPNVLFFPENQPNQVITYIEYPEGTDIAKTNALTEEIEQKVFEAIC